MTLEEYELRLKKHDWYFRYSDDARVFRAGQEEEKKLLETSLKSKEHEKIYITYCDKYFPNGKLPEGTKPA